MADASRALTSVSLTDRVAWLFDGRVRSRGGEYYAEGRVKLGAFGGSDWIGAVVRGRARYDVAIEIHRQPQAWTLYVDCTCPYVDSLAGFCKHIWATLLAAERYKTGPPWGFGAIPETVNAYFMDDGFEDDDAPGARAGQFEAGDTVDELLQIPGIPEELRSMLKNTQGARCGKGASAREWDRAKKQRTPDPPAWVRLLREWASSPHRWSQARTLDDSPIEPIYILEADDSAQRVDAVLSLAQQKKTATGKPGKVKRLQLSPADVPRISGAADRKICLLLLGAGALDGPSTGYRRYYDSGSYGRESKWTLPAAFQDELLPLLSATGRFFLRHLPETDLVPIQWDGGAWEPVLSIERCEPDEPPKMIFRLRRGDESLAPFEADCFIDGNPALFVRDGILGRVVTGESAGFHNALAMREPLPVVESDLPRLLEELARVEALPSIEFPDDWGVEIITDRTPEPQLSLRFSDSAHSRRDEPADAEVRFLYQGNAVEAFTPGRYAVNPEKRQVIRRQPDVERRGLQRLHELGVRTDYYKTGFEVPVRRIGTLVTTLVEEGWSVLGNRKPYRRPGQFKIDVTTGIDWFDVNAEVDFDGERAGAPELLAALRRGDRFLQLGDGSFGMLPDTWLAQHRPWLDLGRTEGGRVRFAKTQIGLIDALLAEMPEATCDKAFAAARKKLHAFEGVKPLNAPRGFAGTLRPYQRDGLGWFRFLEEFAWGGCLADDMGLGKTVQILGLLADRRRQRKRGPSVVVAPKSVVFNWAREAERFAPRLKVLNYTGGARQELRPEIAESDLVLTTYGTLRRDIKYLAKQRFNYVVLDEAQAIKNPDSQSAKAARLLNASRRMALTGTPVENHLGDLWSILEFLNPGMLGAAKAFKSFSGQTARTDPDPRNLRMLQRAVRPFILRRTKAQVAPELPPRIEQTIQCELGAGQARCYAELRDHYRASLLKRVDDVGLARSKMHVLEALLRLRQAACHPGLIDRSKEKAGSAKLDSLLAMIDETVSEGHKALIYSQFTTMLAFVRGRLDRRGLTYEYLDGKTRDRAARVDRFQTDPDCPLFLVSLKAGGVGLNLTAAEYVFILDPWWNPAVEAQAIDRAHRIGQDRQVMAYRLIARNTVEEKILELQRSKQALAESIITEKNSLIRTLTRDDLAALLA